MPQALALCSAPSACLHAPGLRKMAVVRHASTLRQQTKPQASPPTVCRHSSLLLDRRGLQWDHATQQTLTHTLPAHCREATKKVSASAATTALTAEPGSLDLAGGVGALSCAAHSSCCRLACLCCWGSSSCRVGGGSSRCCGLALPAAVVCHGSSSHHAQCGDGTSDQQATLGCCWCGVSSGGAVCACLQALGALDRGLHSCGAGCWGLSNCRCHRGGHHHGCLLLLWGWGLDLGGQQHM